MSIEIRLEKILYKSGETVNAFVDVVRTEETLIKQFSVDFSGISSAIVKGVCFRKSKRQIRHFFERTVIQFNDLDDFKTGLTSFPVSYQLPLEIPSSVEGKKISTVYQIEVYWSIVRTDTRVVKNAPPLVTRKKFLVEAPLDLNYFNSAVNRCHLQVEECVRNLLGVRLRGLVSLSFQAPTSGVTSKENVSINIQAYNTTAVEVKEIVLQLVQALYFSSVNATARDEQILLSFYVGSLPPQSDIRIQKQIVMPDLVPTSNRPNVEVDISYFYRVIFRLPTCYKTISKVHPIVVGSLPIIRYSLMENLAVPNLKKHVRLYSEHLNCEGLTM